MDGVWVVQYHGICHCLGTGDSPTQSSVTTEKLLGLGKVD